MKKLSLIVAVVFATLGFSAAASANVTDQTINVDGQTYQAYKVVGNGNTWHFNTPNANPSSATATGTDGSGQLRNQSWTGNGSENLPCEGGIHWISNKNVLTISNCLETPPETTVPPTTEPPVTTVPPTTEPPVTTIPPTTEPPVTTTPPSTEPPVTDPPPTDPPVTTEPPVVTDPPPESTEPPVPPTAPPTQPPPTTQPPQLTELPETGAGEWIAVFILGLAAVVGGTFLVRIARRNTTV